MEIKTWSERAQAFPMSQRLDERTFMREEITDLRLEIERQAQEVLKLHRDLAAEKLRADQGWHRYESANSRKNELEAERANWAQEIAALKAAMSADESAQTVIMSEDDAEQLARSKWTIKQWYEHVGAWENAQGEVCFGSVMALGAMLKLMTKARHSAIPVSQQDAKPLCYVRQSDIDSPIGSAIWAYRMAGGEWTVPVHVSIKEQPQ